MIVAFASANVSRTSLALTQRVVDHRGLEQQKAPISGGFVERMMGLEPTTFSLARRRSSQLSYIRERGQYSRGGRALGLVQGLVDELVGQLVVLAAHRGVVDAADPACQAARFE